MVVQAYILIQTDVGKAAEVAAEIAEVKGVTLAEDVTGPYDVIVRAEARNVDELGKLVVAKVQNIPGITRTPPAPWCTSDLVAAPLHASTAPRSHERGRRRMSRAALPGTHTLRVYGGSRGRRAHAAGRGRGGL